MIKSRFTPSAGTAASAARLPAAGALPPFPTPRYQWLLTAIAGHTRIVDPDRCLKALALLPSSRTLRRSIGPQIGSAPFREAGFVTLLTLYALEPAPSDPEALAREADIPPARMQALLGRLERQGLVACGRGQGAGQGPRVYLTEPGTHVIVAAVHRFLHLASTLGTAAGSSFGA
jgi:DNA-binding MarR family transcriptional regulator